MKADLQARHEAQREAERQAERAHTLAEEAKREQIAQLAAASRRAAYVEVRVD